MITPTRILAAVAVAGYVTFPHLWASFGSAATGAWMYDTIAPKAHVYCSLQEDVADVTLPGMIPYRVPGCENITYVDSCDYDYHAQHAGYVPSRPVVLPGGKPCDER